MIRTLVVLGLLGGIGYAGVKYYPEARARVFKTEVRSAEVGVLSPVQASTALTATGYVVPLTTSRVAPRAFGRVARVHVREGEVVREGQLLLEFDAQDQRSALAAARARLLAANARVATARANLEEARQQAARQRALVERGAAPRSGLEDLESRERVLQAMVSAAVAETRVAQADISVQQTAIGQLTIHAPIAGTVLTRPPQVGEVLNPEVPGLEIADFGSLVIEVDVPEARLHLVRVGAPCEIVLDAFPSRRFRGTTVEIGRRVDRTRASLAVRVRFAEGADQALPNMAGRVSFLTSEMPAEAERAASRVVVPASAVTTRGGERVVFVIEDGVVHPQRVRTGARIGDDVELLEGPHPRTRVVLSPPASLNDGNRIRETQP